MSGFPLFFGNISPRFPKLLYSRIWNSYNTCIDTLSGNRIAESGTKPDCLSHVFERLVISGPELHCPRHRIPWKIGIQTIGLCIVHCGCPGVLHNPGTGHINRPGVSRKCCPHSSFGRVRRPSFFDFTGVLPGEKSPVRAFITAVPNRRPKCRSLT